MNHKLKMHELERFRRDKLEEVIHLQKEISAIDTSISYHKRMYKMNNAHAEECGVVLDGYNRQNVKGILKFLVDAISGDNGTYRKYYKDVDVVALMDDESFFDFLIVQIGRGTIVDMKKRFQEVAIIDGKMMIATHPKYNSNQNFNKRVFKKLTKKNVITEAKRISDA
jgi:hypothetical protein